MSSRNALSFFFVITFISIILIFFIPSDIVPISNDFRNNLWGPAFRLIQQESPYNIHETFEQSNAVWMPTIIGLLFPIGFLPIQWASNLWLVINISALITIVCLIIKVDHKNLFLIPVVVIALTVFPSTLSHFSLGQVSTIICLFLFLMIRYREKMRSIEIGLLLTLSLTKPQLLVVFIPSYFVLLYREQGIKQIFRVIQYSIIWMVILCLPLFLLYPKWIRDFYHNLIINQDWFYPSVYSYLKNNFDSSIIVYIITLLLLLIGIGVSIKLTIKHDKYQSLLWSLAITPFFAPIIWSWDFVLIYPLLVHFVSINKTKTSSWILYSGYAICTFIFIFMRSLITIEEHFYIWIPPFLIAISALFTILNREKI